MAASETSSSGSGSTPVESHETALCIIPPKHLWPSVDRLRALYDKAYEKWPPHINLIYPFVRIESLEKAAGMIKSGLGHWRSDSGVGSLQVYLDAADVFPHRHDNTIFIHDSNEERNVTLLELRAAILKALGYGNRSYKMHMTVGQSDDLNGDPHKFLLHKASLLPKIEWQVEHLFILVRERLQIDRTATSQMMLWGTFSLANGALSRLNRPSGFYATIHQTSSDSDEEDADAEMDELQTSSPFSFDEELGLWKRGQSEGLPLGQAAPDRLAVASYNVLAEFTWPTSQARYPLIIKNILSNQAAADVLVLQEVTDDFLSYLLRDENIRKAYPFVSHGPPEQPDIDPLPSLLNLVVLSEWAFDWKWVSFKRRHKGSVVVKFKNIGKWEDTDFLPVVLATVHLTCGLTDGSISNKKIELQSILNYLKETYPGYPWILAGDFNITTSSHTIEAALLKKAISAQTSEYLSGFENMFASAGFVDSWSVSRHELGDVSDGEQSHDAHKEIFDGEQGATFDPTVNSLASKIVGSGFNNRPQRYDRILVRGEDLLKTLKFNKFGYRTGNAATGEENVTFASDHWGVRCILSIGPEPGEKPVDEVSCLVVPVHIKKASPSLGDPRLLRDTLSQLNVFPTEEEVNKRATVFDLLKSVLTEASAGETTDATGLNRFKPALVMVPVGSYGLGVWTSTSDIDCLCIGPFSANTFFALATQRLRKADAQGVKILRRVRANSGTMLELEVQGVKIDLQYCPAAAIAETWPEVLKLPASDPIFTLPAQTLAKLKAIRDLDYARRSVPDIVKFRTAYRFIKTWAKARGIYSVKFGFLGGIQISVLLARVCKLLTHDSGSASVPDILTTFFHHYATFDWKHKIVFDPFFHKQRLQYTRTAREPLAILGYYPPSLNTSHAASLPSVRTIAEEIKRADRLLAEDGMTWSKFLCNEEAPSSGALDIGGSNFLRAYKSYVKIDVQYWGLSLAKGAAFVGWLESRCVMVLVDISRRAPTIHARMWPARFVDAASSDEDRDYQGYYLIGLDKLDADMSKEDLKVAFGALQTVLRRFEEQIRGDEKFFDAKSEWMSTSIINQSDLGDMRVDWRDWGEYTLGDDESDEEEEEEQSGEDLSREDDEETATPARKTKKQKKQQQAETVVVPKPETRKKFRTAHDVIKRLRWDPSLDSGDYIVGYEDRFVGAREKALDMWKSEQTDEEFIPQHRVLYFKRKSDGAIVWERTTRIDKIFGSGV